MRRVGLFRSGGASLDDARRRKDVVVLTGPRSDTRSGRCSASQLPSIRLFGQGEDDEPLRQLVGRVEDVSSLPGGLFRFRIEGADHGIRPRP